MRVERDTVYVERRDSILVKSEERRVKSEEGTGERVKG